MKVDRERALNSDKSTLRDLLRGQSTALQDRLAVLTDRGRRLFDNLSAGRPPADDLGSLCELLLSNRGQASGVALAASILEGYRRQDDSGRLQFFNMLRINFGIDSDKTLQAVNEYQANPTAQALAPLQHAVEPTRQELFRRLNQAPEGTAQLVAMRHELLALLSAHPGLKEVDADLVHLFHSWFNRGFLELRQIDWNTSAAILNRIIRYEAVHEIFDWDDLRRRIDPPDRRLYAFFHPSLPGEPLIFVEVALTKDIAGNIASILATDRDIVESEDMRTAVFYSISNCQDGLCGISFGNFLIKQVLEEIKLEIPPVKFFVTLSPMPGFAKWLRQHITDIDQTDDIHAVLAHLEDETWVNDGTVAANLEPLITALAAFYLTQARTASGDPLDPVARFHLGNGARLERINWLADLSAAGQHGSHGVMVNYLYKPEDIEANHAEFTNSGRIATSNGVQKLAESAPQFSERDTA